MWQYLLEVELGILKFTCASELDIELSFEYVQQCSTEYALDRVRIFQCYYDFGHARHQFQKGFDFIELFDSVENRRKIIHHLFDT